MVYFYLLGIIEGSNPSFSATYVVELQCLYFFV